MKGSQVGPADPILLYGATGYTAGLVIERLLEQGVRPVLAARNAGALQQCAQRTGLPYRAARLDEPGSMRAALDGMRVMLNLAGPYRSTAEPALEACLQAGVHYLDVSGEVDALAAVSRQHGAARARGVMLMAGIGFDVVPSDCLCAFVSKQLGDVHTLFIGVSGLELASPGSLRTLVHELGRQTRIWRGGALREAPPGEQQRSFDFGSGPRLCAAVSWGDLVTAPITTGALNVETYFEQTPMVAAFVQYNRTFAWAHRSSWSAQWLQSFVPQARSGPTAEQRASRQATIVVEGRSASGRALVVRARTPEVYSLTAETAAVIAARVLAGDSEPGFQTPGRLFGADFILRFSGVTRQDYEVTSGS